jgi:ABC-type uncharacterized transport system involved in gliding motility auxiliary subunit
MNNKLSTPLILVVLVALFFALVLVNNQLLSGTRLDLTQNQIYSLSQGSKKVLEKIDEPLDLYFFFSDKSSKNMTSLRNYANRIESLLEEYNKVADGKIRLHIVDPEPFSEAEDQANQFGLTAANLGAAGDAIYMGLAGSNALGDQKTIAFFDPQKESFLEYDISKVIYQLSDSKPVKVSILTDLSIAGGQNPMTGQAEPQWTFYNQLEQLYQVELIGSDATALPVDTDVLVLIHPQELSQSLLFAIDQYVLSGGKMMAFLDPHHESDPMAMMSMSANSSNLSTLLDAWGVHFNSEQVLLDAMAGLDIRTQAGGVTRHFGFLGLGAEQLDREDMTTANLESVNGASFGVFTLDEKSQLNWLPLFQSTENSDLMDSATYAAIRDPEELAKQYNSDNKRYVLAARVTGKAKSSFTEVPQGAAMQELVTDTNNLNVILVGDTDLLTDRFWVQQANFFGQTIFTPFANNGDFITNGVENLGGSDALISIRSRGTFARPFTMVNELEVRAEEKFRQQEQLLQKQLADTEAQLLQLQSQQGESTNLVITPEQQQAIDEFMAKKIEIRKELREVRHQLDKDIENLGNWLKFINIAVMPLILMLVLMLIVRLFRTQSRSIRELN